MILRPILLTLSIAIVVSSCKPKEADLGPQTSVEAIENAIGASFAEYDPNTMKVGEWTHLDATQEFGGNKYLLSDMNQQIVIREDDAVEATFRALERRRFFENSELKKTVDTEFKVVWKFGPPSTSVTQRQGSDLFGDPIYRLSNDLSQMQASADTSAVTYHNLKSSVAYEKPPELFVKENDCAAQFPNCEIKVYTVSFDIVIRDGGTVDVLKREYRLSPQVPYLSAVLSECLAGVVPLENSRIFVKECTEARNFRFGSGSTSTTTP